MAWPPELCPGCGKKIKKRPRSGKLRYRHKCPHGELCAVGDPLWGTHYTTPRCQDCVREASEEQKRVWV